jgi:AraC-like DNA-binding protein
MIDAARLDRFPLVRTHDVDEMLAALERVYAKPKMNLAAGTRRVNTAINYLPMNFVGLGNSSFGTDVSFTYAETELFLQTFPLRGSGEAAVNEFVGPLHPSRGVVASPGMHFTARLEASYETVLLLIKPQGLADKLTALIGRQIAQPLRFDPIQDYNWASASALRQHVFAAVQMLNVMTQPLPRLLLAAFEESLAVTFLRANRHNYSHLLECDALEAAPWQVCRAEDYIAAEAGEAITLERLAEITEVSALSLLRSFRQRRGHSLRQFLSRMRLEHARDLLRHPNPATTVTGVAVGCGFADAAGFDREYAQAFGERPAQTLRRGRGDGPLQ